MTAGDVGQSGAKLSILAIKDMDDVASAQAEHIQEVIVYGRRRVALRSRSEREVQIQSLGGEIIIRHGSLLQAQTAGPKTSPP